MATLIYDRHHKREEENHDTVEQAVEAAFWGSDGGHIFPIEITDNDNTIWQRNADGSIFTFAKQNGYVDEDV